MSNTQSQQTATSHRHLQAPTGHNQQTPQAARGSKVQQAAAAAAAATSKQQAASSQQPSKQAYSNQATSNYKQAKQSQEATSKIIKQSKQPAATCTH